ncbi:MAG: Y_Y_Y domain protein [Methanomassiliicoccales archaeon PtaU1.Bin124]|nr:MAG: Y_Y_Y domain protein [Methanomassiliicoccales archaeon PtaU1.Bin124]
MRGIARSFHFLVVASLMLSFFFPCSNSTCMEQTTYDGFEPALITYTGPIRVNSNDELAALISTEGWNGSGTEIDPFQIENLLITASSSSSGIFIGNTTAHLIISNCSVTSAASKNGGAIQLNNADNCDIVENTCKGFYDIYLFSSNGNSISNNSCTGTSNNRIQLASSSTNTIAYNTCHGGSHSINLGSSSNGNTIRNNDAGGTSACGIVLTGSGSNRILNNTITGSGNNGLRLSSSSNQNLIWGNSIVNNNNYGIKLESSSAKNTISNNNCDQNSYGIYLSTTTGNVISNNTVTKNDNSGIYLTSANGNRIDQNTCSENVRQGINLVTSNNNRIYGNQLIDNNGASSAYSSAHVQCSDGGKNVWNATDHGNYWSDWTSPDGDLDGIVDTNYAVDGGTNRDYYPLALAVTITSPTSPSYTSEGTIDISGTASGYYSILGVSWHNEADDTFGLCDGTDSWSSTVDLALGNNNIVVTATDERGVDKTANVTVIRTTSGPTLIISAPLDGSYQKTGTVTISWTAAAPAGITKVEVSADGGGWTSAIGSSHDILLGDGPHTVLVRLTDALGGTAEDSVSFVIDTIGPVITITKPSQSIFLNTSTLTAEWTSSDSGSGIVSTEINIDSGAWSTVTGNAKELILTDGVHTISIRTTDAAGNEKSASVSFTIDTVVPNASIVLPGTGTFLNRSNVAVELLADDAIGIGKSEIGIDGNDLVPVTDMNFELSLGDGPHTILFKVTDLAGNFREMSVVFTVDTVAPTVSIISPPNDSVNPEIVTIEWMANDDGSGISKVEINVDDLGWEMATGFNMDLTLGDGPHTVKVRATDAAGNVETTSVTFVVDTLAPTVGIAPPSSTGYINTSSVKISWSASASPTSMIASTEVKVDDGSWNIVSGASVALELAEGPHVIFIKVTDDAGRISMDSVSIIIDSQAPVLEIAVPTSGSWGNSTSLNATWISDDPTSGIAFYWASIDGEQWNNVTHPYLVLHDVPEGQHSLRVRAYDVAGNCKELTSSFGIETTAPSLIILTPRTGIYLTASDVFISWNAEALSGIDEYWIAMNGGGWIGKALVSSHSFESLPDGDYSVRIRVMDRAGNWNESAVLFSIDTVSPMVTAHSPTGSSEPHDVVVALRFSESMNKSSVRVLINGEIVTASWTDDLTIEMEMSFDYGMNYSIAMMGSDIAGNPLEFSWSFGIEKGEGTISGVIRDADGDPVANAIVSLSNGMTCVTNETGCFSFANVSTGSYKLTISKEGYQTMTRAVSSSPEQINEIGASTLSIQDPAPEPPGPDNGNMAMLLGVVAIAGIAGACIFVAMRLKGKR